MRKKFNLKNKLYGYIIEYDKYKFFNFSYQKQNAVISEISKFLIEKFFILIIYKFIKYPGFILKDRNT